MNNPELAGNTNLFPAKPLVSEQVWEQIETFYLAKAPTAQPPLPRPAIPESLTLFKAERLPFTIESPTTTFVAINGSNRSVTFADAKTETIYDAKLQGGVNWSFNVSNIVTSVRLTDSARYIVGIGDFFPSDDALGQVLVQALDGSSPKVLLGNLPRTTHIEPGDFNGDGQIDFALSVFGNLLGRFSWFERQASGGFVEHVLFNKSGALKSIARDFDGNGTTDLAVLVAQNTEALLLYLNDGKGHFTEREVFRKPPSYGHTDFEAVDFNQDGRLDFVVATGDNADFQTQPRPYQGIRIYLAETNAYREAYFFPFPGGYHVVARDFDGDGDLDIAAVSFFPDYKGARPEPFVYLENRGNLQFEPSTFAGANQARWVTLDAGDLDGDGDMDLALGALVEMPDNVPKQYVERWAKESPSVLILRNQTK